MLVLRDLDAVLVPHLRGGRRARLLEAATRVVRALTFRRADGELVFAFDGDSPLVPSFVAAAAAIPTKVASPRIVLVPRGDGIASLDSLVSAGDETHASGDSRAAAGRPRGSILGIGFASSGEVALAPGIRQFRAARGAREEISLDHHRLDRDPQSS